MGAEESQLGCDLSEDTDEEAVQPSVDRCPLAAEGAKREDADCRSHLFWSFVDGKCGGRRTIAVEYRLSSIITSFSETAERASFMSTFLSRVLLGKQSDSVQAVGIRLFPITTMVNRTNITTLCGLQIVRLGAEERPAEQPLLVIRSSFVTLRHLSSSRPALICPRRVLYSARRITGEETKTECGIHCCRPSEVDEG